MEVRCIARKMASDPLRAGVILSSIPLLLAGVEMGLSGRPLPVSYLIMVSVVLYTLLSLVSSPLRIPPLVLALGLHVGALISYYSDPLILPLIIIERGQNGDSINIDLIQVLLLLEASNIPNIKTACSSIEGENKNTLTEEEGDTGRESPAREEEAAVV